MGKIKIDKNKIKVIWFRDNSYNYWKCELVELLESQGGIFIGRGCSTFRIEPYALEILCKEGQYDGTYYLNEKDAIERCISGIKFRLNILQDELEKLEDRKE